MEHPILSRFSSPLVLAPMAGVTDRVFRRICRYFGSGAACTPMVSARSIVYGNRGTAELMESDPDEAPLALQLFGHEAEDFTRAIGMTDLSPYAFIDINMGCPAPKVTRQGEGSALMRDPANAEKIIRAAVQASPVPVSVKFRSGWDEDSRNAAEFAQMAQDAGASLLCLHPRTAKQLYSGKADYDMFSAVAEKIRIPLVGSGDVTDAASAKRMLNAGCSAAMIGRATYGDPWIFARINASFGGEEFTEPTLTERLGLSLAHARMLTRELPEHVAMLQMRKHIAWYVHGVRGAAAMRGAINDMTHLTELEQLLCAFVGDEAAALLDAAGKWEADITV